MTNKEEAGKNWFEFNADIIQNGDEGLKKLAQLLEQKKPKQGKIQDYEEYDDEESDNFQTISDMNK